MKTAQHLNGQGKVLGAQLPVRWSSEVRRYRQAQQFESIKLRAFDLICTVLKASSLRLRFGPFVMVFRM